MICCLLTFQGDIQSTQNLLSWMAELGGCPKHDLVLVADAGTSYDGVHVALEHGRKVFKSARIITNEKSVTGWPDGSWSLFKTAIQHVREPFVLLEPDSIPLKAGWLDLIEAEYRALGKPFMGHIYSCQQAFLPDRLMSGVGCYPGNMRELLPPAPTPQAWDVYSAAITVANGADTKLIRHFYGQKDLPPFFVRERHARSPINALPLNAVPTGCVLWHRDKTHSLIDLLGNRPEKPQREQDQSLLIVLPFCTKDGQRMHHTLTWMRDMGGCENHDALLSYEEGTPAHLLLIVRTVAAETFRSVEETSYPRPVAGEAVQTMAWRHAALHISQNPRPWLWNEADAIPLRDDWITVLERAYRKCGKAFAGPKVGGMSHYNGCMIYAGNTPALLPQTVAAKHCVWDINAAVEMAPQAADIGHLHFHAWGMIGGALHPFTGTEPHFANQQSLHLIPSSAVILHRCKDGSLIKRLREKHKR